MLGLPRKSLRRNFGTILSRARTIVAERHIAGLQNTLLKASPQGDITGKRRRHKAQTTGHVSKQLVLESYRRHERLEIQLSPNF
jgi:hypothetical protein